MANAKVNWDRGLSILAFDNVRDAERVRLSYNKKMAELGLSLGVTTSPTHDATKPVD